MSNIMKSKKQPLYFPPFLLSASAIHCTDASFQSASHLENTGLCSTTSSLAQFMLT